MLKSSPSYPSLLKVRHLLLVWLFVFGSGLAWGQTTKTFNQSNGSWTTAANWTPSGAPAATDNLIIPASVTGTITDIPGNTTVNSLEIQGSSGTVTFQNAFPSNDVYLLTVSSSFSIQSGKTFVLAQGNGNRRFSMAFGVNCTATVNGTIEIPSSSGNTSAGVLNSGTVSMGPNGLIQNGGNSGREIAFKKR